MQGGGGIFLITRWLGWDLSLSAWRGGGGLGGQGGMWMVVAMIWTTVDRVGRGDWRRWIFGKLLY